MRVALVGCGKRKLQHLAEARDLYTGPLFRAARRFAETCDAWCILSAKHGLVDPRRILAPYDTSMASLSRVERARWADEVRTAILARWPAGSCTLVFLAGVAYAPAISGILAERPIEGLKLGHRLRWFKEQRRTG